MLFKLLYDCRLLKEQAVVPKTLYHRRNRRRIGEKIRKSLIPLAVFPALLHRPMMNMIYLGFLHLSSFTYTFDLKPYPLTFLCKLYKLDENLIDTALRLVRFRTFK